MNAKDDRDLVTMLYDELLANAAEDMTLADTTEALVPAVVESLRNRERDLEAEAVTLIRASLGNTRSKRANSLRKDLEYIADWYANPAEGASGVEPLMAQAYRLGTHDGRDKTLRYWTMEDFQRSVTARYREASDSTRAAREYDDTASQIINILHAAHADRLEDLLNSNGQAAA